MHLLNARCCLVKDIASARNYGNAVLGAVSTFGNGSVNITMSMWKSFTIKVDDAMTNLNADLKECVRARRAANLEAFTTMFGERDIVNEAEVFASMSGTVGVEKLLQLVNDTAFDDIQSLFKGMKLTHKIIDALVDLQGVLTF